MYIDERDDETISLLSDGDEFLLEYDENDNSDPSCSFGGASLQQQYMGENYFFRQNGFEPEIDYLDIARDSSKIEVRNSSESDDLLHLIEALEKEKLALSQKCSKLETLVDKTRKDHNCYKIQMTMAMGNMRVQMESERDDKAYLLEKCQQLTSELSELRSGFDSKQEKIFLLEQKLRQTSRPMQQQQEEKDTP